jgi:hypothetical protein
MAKNVDQDLFDKLRATGMRKKVARTVAQAAEKADGRGKPPKVVRKTVKDLRSLVGELEDRATGGPEKRKAAAKKAARTRKQEALRRSEAAKRAARTRARA